jgi:hypothetical protein
MDAFGVVYLQPWVQPKPKVRFVAHFAIPKVTYEEQCKISNAKTI